MMFSTNYSDTHIINTIKGNNRKECNKVFKYLYKKNYNKVKSYIIRNSGNETEVEDLFQDALIALIDQIKKGRFKEQCSIGTYLISISKNLWLLNLKSKQRQFEDITNDCEMIDDSLIESIFTKSKNLQHLANFIQSLEKGGKEILMYYYYEGLSISEIKEVLGLGSDQAVRNKKYRCMKKLRDYFGEKKISMEYFCA